MAVLSRYHVSRRLRLATPLDEHTHTRIAALPGINRVTSEQDGRVLAVAYDLRETELLHWLGQANACGLQPADDPLSRLHRWLATWREHNRRRHLLGNSGWPQYLQQAYLRTARDRLPRQQRVATKPWQRYLQKKGGNTTNNP